MDTPLELNVKYKKDDGAPLSDPTIYRRLIGSLNYLTITRPNISHVVKLVSQFTTQPTHLHFSTIKRIICYHLGTIERGSFFPQRPEIHVTAYRDANWISCPDTRHSTMGWCVFLGNALTSWKCKEKDRVSKSSTEVEYSSMSSTRSEVVRLQCLLAEHGFSQATSMPLHADSTSAIQIAANPAFQECTKYIGVDCQLPLHSRGI